MIDLKSKIKAREDIVASNMDGETVMMSIDKGKYYNLGAVGGEIWGLIQEATRVESIVKKLMDKFDVDKDRCESETIEFIKSLIKDELIIEMD